MTLSFSLGTARRYSTYGTDQSQVEPCQQPLKRIGHQDANSGRMASSVIRHRWRGVGAEHGDVVKSDVIYWKCIPRQYPSDALPQVDSRYHSVKSGKRDSLVLEG